MSMTQMGDYRLFVADESACRSFGDATIHACKDKCHRQAVGYGTKEKLPPTHPEYLVARRDLDLYLNIVDAPVPIFRREIFTAALDFIDEVMVGETTLVVHCNGGLSRAPSIALLWLAKRAKTLVPFSFADARHDFVTQFFPDYAPGRGIETFLSEHWSEVA